MNEREDLQKRLDIETDVLRSPAVKAAFLAIDRSDFVPPDYSIEAYEDYPLPIGRGQTISQPTTVAFMLEKLGTEEGDTVLDVGSGSGFTTALLAHIVGERGAVVGVERIPELVDMGNENLSKYNFPHAKIVQAGEELGMKEKGPFDRILVSASADDENMAEELLIQLEEGGKMVIPIRDSIVVFEKKAAEEVVRTNSPGFAFVPLID